VSIVDCIIDNGLHGGDTEVLLTSNVISHVVPGAAHVRLFDIRHGPLANLVS
jgi:hypothetical protein